MAAAPPYAPTPAAASTRPAGPTRAPSERAGWTLLVAFCACLLYGSFSQGATEQPQECALQVALAVVATLACAAWLYESGMRLRASRAGWAGLALLVGFAAWSGASIAWSVAPDKSWIELNRAIAYTLAALLGLFAG